MVQWRFLIHAQLFGLDQLPLVRGQKEKRAVGRARQAGDDHIALKSDQYRDYPARAILRGATKEQLEKAPEFRYSE